MSRPRKAPEEEAPVVTQEMIEQRAYELSQEDGSGTPEENWHRAEQELLEKPLA